MRFIRAIGDKCVSAKVDGLRVPLWTRLSQTGNRVVIITRRGATPTGPREKKGWIDLVVTGRAKIRHSPFLARRGPANAFSCGLARSFCAPAFDAIGREMTGKAIATAARMLGIASESELRAQCRLCRDQRAQSGRHRCIPKVCKSSPRVDATRPRGLVLPRTSPFGGPPVVSRFRMSERYQGDAPIAAKGVRGPSMDLRGLAELRQSGPTGVGTGVADGTHPRQYYGVVMVGMTISRGGRCGPRCAA